MAQDLRALSGCLGRPSRPGWKSVPCGHHRLQRPAANRLCFDAVLFIGPCCSSQHLGAVFQPRSCSCSFSAAA